MCGPRTNAAMTLSEYMTAHGLSASEMARRIGCSHSTVLRLNAGTLKPSFDLIQRVVAATADAVQPGDFFTPTPAPQPEVAA